MQYYDFPTLDNDDHIKYLIKASGFSSVMK